MFTVKTGKETKIPTRNLCNRISIGGAILLSCGITIALVFQARFYPELGYDESASVLGLSILSGHFGNHIDPMGPLGFDRHFVMDCFPPVYFLVQAIIFKLFGFGIVAARAASELFVGATALLCFWGAKRVAGPAAGYVAMAIFLIVPLQIYTLVARPDVAVPFFLLASLLILSFIDEVQTKRWQFALAGLLFSLAVLSHFVALMAGPVVAALLWRQSGRSFWRTNGFYAFLLGFFVPMACYAVLLHPYQLSTIQHLIRYTDVGLGAAPASVMDHWPLRPTLQHLGLHQSYLPWMVLGMLPLSATVAIAGFKFPVYRARLTTAGWLLALSFLGLWFMVGTYPNIAVYGYYGPAYLSLGAVVLGYSLLSPFPKSWLDKPIFIVICAAVATMMTFSLAKKAWRISDDYRNIPIAASLAWTAEFPQLQETMVLATPHWIFSSAADRVRTYTLLRLYEGYPALSHLYQRSVPGSGTLSDYGAAIFDKSNESHVLQKLVNFASLKPDGMIADRDPNKILAAEKMKQRLTVIKPEDKASFLNPYSPFAVLLSSSYRIVGLHHDDLRISNDYAVLAIDDKPASSVNEWPRLAISTSLGPENLSVDPSCSVSLSGSLLPLPEPWTPWLTTYVLPLETVPETKDLLLAVRIVTNTSEQHPKPVGFAAYFPTIAKMATARHELAAYRVPPVEADVSFSLLGFALSKGEVGREMLIRPGGEDSGSVLTIHQTEPATIDRIDIAFALPPHRKCDQMLIGALKKVLVKATQQPKPYVTSVLNGTISGTPITINLSAKATGEAVIWQAGQLVGRQRFQDMNTINIPISVPGKYGIEVWFDGDSPPKNKRVEAVYPSVADKP